MLIVRVKRNRNEDPAENICVVEDANPAKKRSVLSGLADHLASLNTKEGEKTAENVVNVNHLMLTRIKTIEYQNSSSLDVQTVGLNLHSAANRVKRNISELTESESEKFPSTNTKSSATQPAAKVMVTRGRKTLAHNHKNSAEQSSGSYVVIDMTQMETSRLVNVGPAVPANATSSSAASGVKMAVKVLDPPTRMLERGASRLIYQLQTCEA